MMEGYVLITGAAGGVGKAFAAECAARGWGLLLTDIHEDSLNPLAEGLRRLYGVHVVCIVCDLTEPASRELFWISIENQGLHFHTLINVAGMEFEGLFIERSLFELRTIMRLNIEAVVEMSSCVLKYRHPGQVFCIINISSLAAFYPMPLKAVYASSKRFLLNFSLALRQELKSCGVNVLAVCPAGMLTSERSIRGIKSQGIIGQITKMNVNYVAARSLDLALAGRGVYIPGIINRVLQSFNNLLPAPWITALLWKRWVKLQKKMRT